MKNSMKHREVTIPIELFVDLVRKSAIMDAAIFSCANDTYFKSDAFLKMCGAKNEEVEE